MILDSVEVIPGPQIYRGYFLGPKGVDRGRPLAHPERAANHSAHAHPVSFHFLQAKESPTAALKKNNSWWRTPTKSSTSSAITVCRWFCRATCIATSILTGPGGISSRAEPSARMVERPNLQTDFGFGLIEIADTPSAGATPPTAGRRKSSPRRDPLRLFATRGTGTRT